MATISEYLNKIATAVYGKDVRQSIVDAIKQCYIDTSEGVTPKIVVKEKDTEVTVMITIGTEVQSFTIKDGVATDEQVKTAIDIAIEEGRLVGESILDTKDYVTEAEFIEGGTYCLLDLEMTTGVFKADGTIGLSSNEQYKHVKIPYTEGMLLHWRYNATSNSTTGFEAIKIINPDESIVVPEYAATSISSVYETTLTGYEDGATVVVNMYNSLKAWNSSTGTLDDYQYTVTDRAEPSETITRPAFDDEFVPTINDTEESKYKSFSSAKILELTGMKSERPANGVEHFTIILNSGNQGDNSGTLDVQDGVTEITDDGVIFIPSTYTPTGTPTRLIISCHGSGTVIDDSFSVTSKHWNEFLYKMGYAILDVNGGIEDSRHFGNPVAVQSYLKAYHYVMEKYNLYKEVFIVGGSMGGLPAFTIAQMGVIPALAVGGLCPVVDLYRQAWCYPWYSGANGNDYSQQRRRIAEYFNFNNYDTFSGWTTAQKPSESERQYFIDNIDKVAGYNPILIGVVNANDVLNTEPSVNSDAYNALVKIPKVPIKIWQADTDPTVPCEFGKYFVQAVKNGGGVAEHRSYPSGGHTPGWGNDVTVTDATGADITATTSVYEMYLWFKRFE